VEPVTHAEALVVVLTPTCAWNAAAIGFYRDLLNVPNRPFDAIAVLPVPVEEGRSFVESLGLTPDDVRQSSLYALHVRSAPALLVVDRDGAVRSAWTGPMSAADQIEARQMLHIADGVTSTPRSSHAPQGVAIVAAIDVADVIRAGSAPVIDIRSRTAYEHGHLRGALSIPADELRSRAIHELPIAGPTIVYCGPCPTCRGEGDEQRLTTLCTAGARQLSTLGFSDIRLLKDDLQDLAKRGLVAEPERR
jgi:rhodanese-related sulfurtransferase